MIDWKIISNTLMETVNKMTLSFEELGITMFVVLNYPPSYFNPNNFWGGLEENTKWNNVVGIYTGEDTVTDRIQLSDIKHYDNPLEYSKWYYPKKVRR